MIKLRTDLSDSSAPPTFEVRSELRAPARFTVGRGIQKASSAVSKKTELVSQEKMEQIKQKVVEITQADQRQLNNLTFKGQGLKQAWHNVGVLENVDQKKIEENQNRIKLDQQVNDLMEGMNL